MQKVTKKTAPILTALTQLLRRESIRTHEELAERLETQGFKVTQSTISRLLRKLHVVKGLNARNELVYLLPKESTPSISAPAQTSNRLVLKIEHNEQLIMVHTPPGSANIVALIIDANRVSCHLLGTIAGDDTILVVPASVAYLDRSLGAVKALLAGK